VCRKSIDDRRREPLIGNNAADLAKVAERCRRHAGIVTKADLIAVIAEKLKFPWARAELLVEEIFSSMADSLMRREEIEIRGFGSFTVRQYRASDGRDPRTGAIVPVRPKRLAFFKVSRELRERVNNGLRSTQAAAAEPGKRI
jgi:integration host factor subunit beta